MTLWPYKYCIKQEPLYSQIYNLDQELETTGLKAMKVIRNYFVLFVLLDMTLPGVESKLTLEIKDIRSKQNLLHEIIQKLANEGVNCLNHLVERTGETFLLNMPIVIIK